MYQELSSFYSTELIGLIPQKDDLYQLLETR